MSAPVLSISERKESISGKKKKKKTIKNVLGIPGNLKVESQIIQLRGTEEINRILESLLPSARLPEQQQNPTSDNDSSRKITSEGKLIAEIRDIRNQLAIGVNALSRSIKKKEISAALIADDIQPKFLVHHLNLLCTHNKVMVLHLIGLKNITKNNLGFPCIALGFKKNSNHFSEVVKEIKLISDVKKNETVEESPVISSSESEEEVEGCNESTNKISETPFTYLFRGSTKERIFIPEKCSKDEQKRKPDLLKLGEEDINPIIKNKQIGISSNLIKKSKLKKLELQDLESDEDDEDLEVPRKKTRKNWVIDTVGERQNYYPVSLRRVPSNPERHRKI